MQRTITWERSIRFGSLSSPSLNNVFQDFADKNKQSNACFYLAILSGAPIKNPRKMRGFFIAKIENCGNGKGTKLISMFNLKFYNYGFFR